MTKLTAAILTLFLTIFLGCDLWASSAGDQSSDSHRIKTVNLYEIE